VAVNRHSNKQISSCNVKLITFRNTRDSSKNSFPSYAEELMPYTFCTNRIVTNTMHQHHYWL